MTPWWDWRKALCGKINQDYKKTFLREDKKLVEIILVVGAVWAIIHAYVEYLDLGLTPSFYLLMMLRLFYLSGSAVLLTQLPTLSNLNHIDFSILIWGIVVVLLAFISNVCRNNLYPNNIGVDLSWVLGFYLILPNRQLYKAIPALLLSIISIYILFSTDSASYQIVTRPSLLANTSSIIAMNFIGFVTSLRIDSHRYQQYMIQKTLIDGRAQLKELASTDSLTGILNRRSFLEMAEIQFDRYKRYNEIFSFVILDIDKLKTINDTYGHPAGDHSIKLIADTINEEKRSSDIVGRLAGDEFGILLPNTTAVKTLEVLVRIKNVLAETIIESPSKQEFQVSFSAGIAEVKKTDKSYDDLYRHADRALFSAKNKGRNKIKNSG